MSGILHIKDGYFFEVPKSLWRQNYETLDDVPGWLRREHGDVKKVDEFNAAMDGKIVIPQPFGTLKNLHTARAVSPTDKGMKSLGFCISKFMILELIVAVLLIVIFRTVGKRIQTGQPVKGRFCNFFEMLLLFIRDEVARPAIGAKDGDRFLPLLWTMFFFILGLNLFGLLPWAGSATAAWGTTGALALVVFCTSVISGMKTFGPVGFFMNQVPSMDLPKAMMPLKFGILAIEVLGLFIKHSVLSIRLLANMVAGHLVLVAVLGLIAGAANSGMGVWSLTAVISVLGATVFSCLELFVAFLQAYIFTYLSALFIGSSIHHH